MVQEFKYPSNSSPDPAETQAQRYLAYAEKIAAEAKGEETADETLAIMTNLLQALQAGSEAAAFKFLDRIRDQRHGKLFNLSAAITTIKTNADKSNALAAYVYARYLAGHSFTGKAYVGTETLTLVEREQDAIAYFERAMTLGSELAKTSLFRAYKLGNVGCIKASQTNWQTFCEKWIQRNVFFSQALALDYGAQLCGFFANGDPVDALDKRKIRNDKKRGLQYLWLAMRGENLKLATSALQRIVQIETDANVLISKLIFQADHGNELAALTLAWHSLPVNYQQHFAMHTVLNLPDLQTKIPAADRTVPKAFTYLTKIAMNREGSELAKIAKQVKAICEKTPPTLEVAINLLKEVMQYFPRFVA